MALCFCSFNPPPQSPSSSTPNNKISKFISSDQHYLSMLETQCTSMQDLKKVHAQFIKSGQAKDNFTASRLLSFAAASPYGDINYAYLLFTRIQNPNIFIWNTIIRGFSQSSNPQFAFGLFFDLLANAVIQPGRLTYPSLFKARSRLGFVDFGAQLHAMVVKLGIVFDPFIRNSLIYMYAICGFLSEAWKLFDGSKDSDVVAWNSMIMGFVKCGDVDSARELFDEMPVRNTVSWNSMISGYVRNGKWKEALGLFSEMQREKIKPSEFTLVSWLNASANLGALKQGEWIHDYIQKNGIELNVIVTTAIINMYSKCGSIEMARQAFEMTPIKGLSCWNSMIIGLAMNGCEDEAIQLFSRLESSSLKPDSVSFIGVLTACNHAGLVNKAKDYFCLMTERYNIEPTIKHYGCMVDLLGRAGHLQQAKELIRSMLMNPDAIIRGSLLSSCRNHGNVEIGNWAQRHLMELDSNESSGHVLMSNVYAASGHFEKAIKERILMKDKRIEKQPGCSLIEVNGEVHEFIAGGRLHPRAVEIYSVLNDLSLILQEMEFVENGKRIFDQDSEITEYIVAS
ncbi:hypothetical protein LguiB_013349 [Lonicera macranthoides]